MANWTPAQLIEWTYANRIRPEQTLIDILEYFNEVAPCRGVFPFQDSEGTLAGIVLAKVDHNTRQVEVTYAILRAKGLLKAAFAVYRERFHGYKLFALRYGRTITYNECLN